MVAIPATLPLEMLTDDNRRRWHQSAIIAVREAQDIYNVSPQDLQKAAITHFIKKHFFEILPKIFDTMVLKLHKEIQENEALDAESYREARILYDESKPFFDEMKDIKIQASTSNEKEYHLQKSLVNFLDALKEYVKYLEIKFSDLDKPKYKTTLFKINIKLNIP